MAEYRHLGLNDPDMEGLEILNRVGGQRIV